MAILIQLLEVEVRLRGKQNRLAGELAVANKVFVPANLKKVYVGILRTFIPSNK